MKPVRENTMNIELSFTLNVDDVCEFQRSYRKIAKKMPRLGGAGFRRAITIGTVIVVAAVVLPPLFRNLHSEPPATAPATRPAYSLAEVFLGLVPYLVLILGVFLYWRFDLSKRLAAQTIRDNPTLCESQHVTFGNDGIATQTPSSSSVELWAHLSTLQRRRTSSSYSSVAEPAIYAPSPPPRPSTNSAPSPRRTLARPPLASPSTPPNPRPL
jgi:hypothetical protein